VVVAGTSSRHLPNQPLLVHVVVVVVCSADVVVVVAIVLSLQPNQPGYVSQSKIPDFTQRIEITYSLTRACARRTTECAG
jgi:hypothetical protein